jgi:hypothetical protein
MFITVLVACTRTSGTGSPLTFIIKKNGKIIKIGMPKEKRNLRQIHPNASMDGSRYVNVNRLKG